MVDVTQLHSGPFRFQVLITVYATNSEIALNLYTCLCVRMCVYVCLCT